MAIYFHVVDTNFNLKAKRRLKAWIKHIIVEEGKQPGGINIIITSNKYIKDINKKYLNHDYETDVISFDLSDEEKCIEGDIYISIEQIKENANRLDVDFSEELRRVIAHGILHLIGYNDKTRKEKTLMVEKENAYLEKFVKCFT